MVSGCRSSGSVIIALRGGSLLHRQAAFSALRRAEYRSRRGGGRRCVAAEGGDCALRSAGYRRLRGGAGDPLSCCIGRRGLRGGTMVWRHAVREGGFSALRRAEYRFLRGGAGVPAFLLHRQAGTARGGDGLAACSPGERFQRFTPRGLLRWRGAHGALRVLFFLGVSPPAKKSTQKRSQALLFFRAEQRSSS